MTSITPQHQDRHAKARVTVDAALFHYDRKMHALKVLLVERLNPPCQGAWALPGGFLDEDDQSLEQAACRELMEETSITLPQSRFFSCGSFGDIGRDPRGRTITAAYVALISSDEASTASAASDARSLSFFNIADLPELAFDHGAIIQAALLTLVLRLGSRFQIDNLVPESLFADLDSAVDLATGLILT